MLPINIEGFLWDLNIKISIYMPEKLLALTLRTACFKNPHVLMLLINQPYICDCQYQLIWLLPGHLLYLKHSNFTSSLDLKENEALNAKLDCWHSAIDLVFPGPSSWADLKGLQFQELTRNSCPLKTCPTYFGRPAGHDPQVITCFPYFVGAGTGL